VTDPGEPGGYGTVCALLTQSEALAGALWRRLPRADSGQGDGGSRAVIRAWTLWVPETLQWLCDLRIFVDQAADSIVRITVAVGSEDICGRARSGAAWPRDRCGR
jgi:hypothetical protein